MTADGVAKLIITEAVRRGYDPVPPLATAIQESSLKPGAVGGNGKWVGIYQQDSSYSDRNNPTANITQFFDRLDAKRKTAGWSTDLWLNIFWLQQRPGETSADLAYRNGRQAYLTEIKSRTGEAQHFVALYGGTMPATTWTGDPVWLEDVLRDALGDRLVVDPTWKSNGTGSGVNGTNQMGEIWGVMLHHTGNSRERPEVIRDGVQQAGAGWLPGPLAQGLITPAGKLHLVAVGPCNHAGNGSYPGLGSNNGNVRLIGFECAWPTVQDDGSFDKGEKWPDEQIATMRDASAAVVKRLGYDGSRVIGHKEYAGASQGKWDPGNLDMPWFRGEVNKAIRGEFSTKPDPTPTTPEVPVPTPNPYAIPKPQTENTQIAQLWDQWLIRWDMLGGRTPVEALAAIGAKLGIDGFKDVR
ncbi:N-acetylmuramoyl-L-alanine amidase [Mycolicibacter heraklionensis]|uniref:N-acetylmuramoyl-L-alanine amidase n=1 Tax=Mycolicibacter heraklionensis TaxID=512402 RepID=UPI000B252591|nr:N-acetylmuramoyl-L-alanine amidase [Mycolicibacter heraklionensis]